MVHRLLPLILLAGCHALVPLNSPIASEDSGPVVDAPVVDASPSDDVNMVVADATIASDDVNIVVADATIAPDDGSGPFPDGCLATGGTWMCIGPVNGCYATCGEYGIGCNSIGCYCVEGVVQKKNCPGSNPTIDCSTCNTVGWTCCSEAFGAP